MRSIVTFSDEVKRFTFQSGDIQIKLAVAAMQLKDAFTFQSGDIQI